MSHTTIHSWQPPITVIHSCAIISTISRLILNRRRGRCLRWHDYIATLSLLLDLMYLSTLWLRGINNQRLQIITSWIVVAIYPSLMWSTRISLGLSIYSMIPSREVTAHVALYAVYLFAVLGAAIAIHTAVDCKSRSEWTTRPPYRCPLDSSVRIHRVSGELISDIILVALPIRAFRNANLPLSGRRLIMAGFTASALTALTSIVAAVLLLGYPRVSHYSISYIDLSLVMAHINAATSLIVCNLLIVITCIYRCFRSESDTTGSSLMTTQIHTHQINVSQSSSHLSSIVWTDLSDMDFSIPESSNDFCNPSQIKDPPSRRERQSIETSNSKV